MCGRYSLFVSPAELAERFEAAAPPSFEPRCNAAPGQSLPVLPDDQSGEMRPMEWGLVPEWADSRDDGGHINARGETLSDRPSFSGAFRQDPESLRAGRCLVPADGFYEWTETDAGTQPYRVTRPDGGVFAMAGLWTEWRPATTQTGLDAFGDGAEGHRTEAEGGTVRTFAVVTTEPNDVVADLHHRMAVILPRERERRWLGASPAEAEGLIEPYGGDLEAYPVSQAVNDPSNDSPALLEPVDGG